ncbi:hypothetical protein KJY73_16485 [Bowmanella sp. Y26]|uniref:hypothetical protein n=1 Tax=Bowmanella yangjiangensis TaxID=2811230 RepID=UPI001BDD53F0|nr:hypothetical protein [Bowmanella yangjiangensis]MBT1065189.1 hypothetical protein [Bowmanella yangjiangensis]
MSDKPQIILRAKPDGKPYDPEFVPADIAAKMARLFENAEVNFLRLSTAAQVVYSESDQHHMHVADPYLVVSSIKALLEKQL